MVARRAQTPKRTLWVIKRGVCGAAVKNRKANAEGIFEHRKRGSSGFEAEAGIKKTAPTWSMLFTLWLPHEDSNPDKQSQSLPCYRYTIGQYLTCFTIIVISGGFVNRILKFFQKNIF